jgi:hypothetical protein
MTEPLLLAITAILNIAARGDAAVAYLYTHIVEDRREP